MKRTIILILTFSIVLPIFSQEKLARFTYSIVDTMKSETEQAREIYNWLTNNIAYDTKQLSKRKKYYSPLETLKRKKAICYGYSELFLAMCNILKIESYLIHGYSKGFGYVKGDQFTSADHAWNIIHADTNWIIEDATWGSGALDYDFDFKTRLLQTFSRKTGIRTKLIFIKNPSMDYFNISAPEAVKTHFPMDSKWQLMDYPVSYETFIADSVCDSPFLNYMREIALVKLRDVQDQIFVDAINSIKYSPYNKFDIAREYYNQANMLHVTKKSPLDSILLKSLERSKCYLDSTLKYLNEFKTIRRSVYKSKRPEQKAAHKQAVSSIKRMQKIPASINNRYERVYKKYLKHEMVYEKGRQSTVSSKLLLPKAVFWAFDTVSSIDSNLFTELTLKNINDLQKIPMNMNELDSLKDSIYAKLLSGYDHNDSILRQVEDMIQTFKQLRYSVDSMDEYQVSENCRKLAAIIKSYDSLLMVKKSLESELIYDFNDFQKKEQKAGNMLGSILETYKRMAKLTGNNLEYSSKADSVLPLLQLLYSTDLQVCLYLQIHNNSWKDLLNIQNKKLQTIGSEGLSDVANQINLFFGFVVGKTEKSYVSDMNNYENIKSSSQKKLGDLREYIRATNKNLAVVNKQNSK